MPDHHDDIPLDQLQIFEDDELIFDGSDPDTFIVIEPGMSPDEIDKLLGWERAQPGSPAYERARRNPAAERVVERLSRDNGV